MIARLLLGPAGSGKTSTCLREIRDALRAAPEGLPLLLLAPKQATFQLERQLLAEPDLHGYTRLHILSFDRLAEYVRSAQGTPPPPLLSEEGRVMVLRALLARERTRLRLFHATARLPGLARQLSDVLDELQHHKLGPQHLEGLANQLGGEPQLRDKLLDFALILRAYLAWLEARHLQDATCLLALATAGLKPPEAATGADPLLASPGVVQKRRSLRPLRVGNEFRPASRAPELQFGGLWLDGFAELTPQELDLLAVVLPRCEQATLAFCLEDEPVANLPWLSPWAVVTRTCRQLLERLEVCPGVQVVRERLPRRAGHGRFAGQPILAHLERHWSRPQPWPGPAGPALRLVACATPEAEAVCAARVVLRFVREQGGRFREVAVLVRSLERYHDVLRRQFQRYGIPVFLDRRESVAHHPLAELTRYVLRTLAFGWQHDDWFGALKTGLVSPDDAAVDELENEALARGWEGAVWRSPLPGGEDPELTARLEQLRLTIIPAFRNFVLGMTFQGESPTGRDLAYALRSLWQTLEVPRQLQQWGAPPGAKAVLPLESAQARLHATVWEEMNRWLDDLALAFPDERLALREWLPILEAGLGNLTVGVIPPALDQVLVGAIDRSRNPDLRLVLLLGLNESVFPAPPPAPQLLTEADRERLAGQGVDLGLSRRLHLGRERYYAYIGCTRAAEQVVLTYALNQSDGKPLNPSPLLGHLRRLFPELVSEPEAPPRDWVDCAHACELVQPLRATAAEETGRRLEALLEALPEAAGALAPLARMRSPDLGQGLSPALAEQLYGPEVLGTSVSQLEQFAACPFKFFVGSGLRAEERVRFQVDARERGSFQHEALARFHDQARREGKQWRDLTVAQAGERIEGIVDELIQEYGAGLFQANPANVLVARGLRLALRDFIATQVAWLRGGYRFDPCAVEVPFGGRQPELDPWQFELGDGHRMEFRGIIDRVDLATDPATGETLCVVVDYKSRARTIVPALLAEGIQMQLPAYLAFLCHTATAQAWLGGRLLRPAGMFYVSLESAMGLSGSRREALEDVAAARRAACQHRGRFDQAALDLLDATRETAGASGQFSYRPPGQPGGRYADPVPGEALRALLQGVEEKLRELGRAIFAGAANVAPYARGSDNACQRCDFRSICRFDPWRHTFRRLGASPSNTQPTAARSGFV